MLVREPGRSMGIGTHKGGTYDLMTREKNQASKLGVLCDWVLYLAHAAANTTGV